MIFKNNEHKEIFESHNNFYKIGNDLDRNLAYHGLAQYGIQALELRYDFS